MGFSSTNFWFFIDWFWLFRSSFIEKESVSRNEVAADGTSVDGLSFFTVMDVIRYRLLSLVLFVSEELILTFVAKAMVRVLRI